MQETINDKLNLQPYNSNRPHLIIPEYGRNIQRMIEYAQTLDNKEERNKCVRAVISVMTLITARTHLFLSSLLSSVWAYSIIR